MRICDRNLKGETEGRSYTINVTEVSHAFNSHGPENEKDARNEPISVDDFATIPDVLLDPDLVVFHEKGKFKSPSLEYRRRINGWLVVIKMITGEGSELNELQFRTLRKEKRKGH